MVEHVERRPAAKESNVGECTKSGGQKNLAAGEYLHAAKQLIKSGANGIYLFNFFTSREQGANAYEPPFAVLRSLGMP